MKSTAVVKDVDIQRFCAVLVLALALHVPAQGAVLNNNLLLAELMPVKIVRPILPTVCLDHMQEQLESWWEFALSAASFPLSQELPLLPQELPLLSQELPLLPQKLPLHKSMPLWLDTLRERVQRWWLPMPVMSLLCGRGVASQSWFALASSAYSAETF